MSVNVFTLGESNTLTAGTSNEVSVGPNNVANLTGQTSVTVTASSSVVNGAYLTAVSGTNATWTDGATLSLTSGATASFSDIARVQASEGVFIGGGIHPDGAVAFANAQAFEGLMKSAMKALIGLNVIYGASVGIADAVQRDSTSVKALIAKFAVIAAANAAAALIVRKLTELLAMEYQAVPPVGSLALTENGVTLTGNFAASTADLLLAPTSVTLTRVGAGASAAVLEMDDVCTRVNFAGDGNLSSLVLDGSSAILGAGSSAVVVTAESATASAGQSVLALVNGGATLANSSNFVNVSSMGVMVTGKLIELG